jgi:poly A polymerase
MKEEETENRIFTDYIPKEVQSIINDIEGYGHEAYIVGGCVRDMLLGKEPKDWDITTNATPDRIKAFFKRTVDTGIKHGTVTVIMGKNTYEVTTYRLDGKYSDGRHPDKVEFSSLLEEDLKRRDFTINAMAFSHKRGLVDLFNGVSDLKNARITCVGSPKERFDEDALRMLRAVRFAARLGFCIDEKTAKAIEELAPNLLKVSKERVWTELLGTLCSDNPEKIELLFDYGIAKYVSESFAYVSIGEDIVKLKLLPMKKSLRLAFLLHKTERDKALSVLKELKSDNDTFTRVRILLDFSAQDISKDRYEIKKLLRRMGSDNFDDLLRFKAVINSDEVKRLKEISDVKEDIILKAEAFEIAHLDITGNDLISAGIEKGPKIGESLEYLLDKLMRGEVQNTKKELERLIKSEN